MWGRRIIPNYEPAENLSQLYKLHDRDKPRYMKYDSPKQICDSKLRVINSKMQGRVFRESRDGIIIYENRDEGIMIFMDETYEMFAKQRKQMFNEFRLGIKITNRNKTRLLFYGKIPVDTINIIIQYVYGGRPPPLCNNKRII